jgi:hypothetical protein
MTDYVIGQWVRRPGKRSKWHLVESDVADRAVVRCGKQMIAVTRSGGELQVSEVMPLTRMIGQPQLCKAGCVRFGVPETTPAPEDDASTAPVDPDVDVP